MDRNRKIKIGYENQYLRLLEFLYLEGQDQVIGNHVCRSGWGGSLAIDLADGFPILTCRKIHIETFKSELIWMMSGETSLRILRERKCKIWDMYGVDDIGKSYGHNMIHWGANDLNQLQKVIDDINFFSVVEGVNYSRRHIIQFYDPGAPLVGIVPPPCYTSVQFLQSGCYLNMIVNYRSTDVVVGLPYDVCVLSLLLLHVAKETNHTAGEILVQFGHIHIYHEHIDLGIVNEILQSGNTMTYKLPRYRFDSVEEFFLYDYICETGIKNIKPVV